MCYPAQLPVAVFEMWWDCSYCDAKALLGRTTRYCPQCGAPQDAAKRYFPPEGQETAFNGTYEGVDKTCAHCGTPNGAASVHCRQCGAPLDGSAAVGLVGATPAPVASKAPARRGRWWPWVVGAVLLVTTCTVLLGWQKETTVTVTGHHWERSIQLERFAPMPDSAWCDSMPAGAYDVRRTQEKRSTRKVETGQKCSTRKVDRGDGTFERREECHPTYRDEPVLDARCHYTIERWAVVETRRLEGSSAAASWPLLALQGKEREGHRSETYTLNLKGRGGEAWACEVPETTWVSAQVGSQRKVQVGVVTGSVSCD